MSDEMKTLEWGPDLWAERTLLQVGLEYTLVDVDLSEIDWAASKHNGARLKEPLVERLIADYCNAMLDGAVFPRTVMASKADGYLILSGNQRSNAVKRLIELEGLAPTTTIAAYVVDGANKMVCEGFARAANRAHGGRSEIAEATANAVYCVQKLGFSNADAARLMNVPVHRIQDVIRANAQRRELAEAGVRTESLSQSHLLELARINDLSTKVKVAHIAHKNHVTATELQPVRQAINKARSHRERLAVVKTMEKQKVAAKPKYDNSRTPKPATIARPWRNRIVRDLTAIGNFLEHGRAGEAFESFADLQINDSADRDILAQEWNRLNRLMVRIMKGG